MRSKANEVQGTNHYKICGLINNNSFTTKITEQRFTEEE